jgi:16S rRNA (cytosine967-C5)-methyltransferase
MVYSVCSTEPEEGEDAVNAFLKTEADFRIIKDAGPRVPAKLMNSGYFRSYPHKHGMDGFFGVSLCRKK